jgi:hypothetical protein
LNSSAILNAKDVAKYSVEYAQAIVAESVKRMVFKWDLKIYINKKQI